MNDLQQYFDKHMSNPTFAFWKQYIDMVSTVLLYIRADRAGDWNVHLLIFKEMLPLMMLYDNVTYARWGTVYLLDMLQVENRAQEVHAEFIAGNYVVKETAGSFNQISADQALKHIIKKGKIAGLVGITKVSKAMSRWIIAFSDRTRLLKDISKMALISFILFYQLQCVVESFSQTLVKSDCYLIRLVIFTIRAPKTNPKHLLI